MKKTLLIFFLFCSVTQAQDIVPMLWKINGTDLIPIDATLKVPYTSLSGAPATPPVILRAIKSANESVANDATSWQNDDHLFVTINKIGTYYLRIELRGQFYAGSGFRWGLNGTTGAPTGTTCSLTRLLYKLDGTVATSVVLSLYPPSESETIYDGQFDVVVVISGYINFVNTGTLNFQWMQYTPSANPTMIKKGSVMMLTEM